MDENKENDLEQTKEIIDLKDLSLEAGNNIQEEMYFQNEDEYLEEEDMYFSENESMETLEEPEEKKELKSEPIKKQNFFSKMSKKNKIIFITGIVLLVILIGIGIYFLVSKKPEEEKPNNPDVILEIDNYRYENGKLIFIENDEELGSYECENKNENLCKVAFLTENNEIDTTRKVDENGDSLKIRSQIYHQRFVFINDYKNESDKEIKLYDMKEKTVLKTIFAITSYENNYLVLKNDSGLYGLEEIGEDGVHTIIPYEYDSLSLVKVKDEYRVIVKKDNNSYLANLENKILTKAFNNTIVGATEHFIKTKDSGNKYNVYDYNAKELSAVSYDYVTLMDEYYLAVLNKSLYVFDYPGNKMIVDPIPLYNESYNPKETYKDLKLMETEKSYDYTMTNALLNIDVYHGLEKENYSINLYEGKLSSTLAYLDYFQGKLYFYKDLEKKELLGTYDCANRNTIEADTKTLENCRVATESFYRETRGNDKEKDESEKVGWIPIFGNQYVFIKDGSDNIILYNLIEKKELAKYESVDTSSYTNAEEITLSNASTIPFIAKSKNSGKFGVAEITNEGVNPVIDFNYKSIKRLYDYYVIESDDGYALYTLDGDKKTENKKNPIVDYHKEYLKTIQDDVYFVHSFTSQISNDAYNYIKLYDEYYAAVINDYVLVYDYKNNLYAGKDEDGKYDEKLKLNLDNYHGDGTRAFRITFERIEGEDYILIEIGNTNGTYGKKISYPVNKKEGDKEDES